MDLHLTPARIADLLAGRTTEEEERALADHLAAGDCPDCEQGLLALTPEQGERLLTVLARVEEPPPLPIPAPAPGPQVDRRPRGRRAWIWAPVAAAAAAALLFALLWLPDGVPDRDAGPSGQRTKGTASSWAPVTMSVGRVVERPDGPASVERLKDGQTLRAGARLVFQLRLEEACWPYLLRISEGDHELLLPRSLERQTRLPEGQHTPGDAGKPLGVDTGALAGGQDFVCLCSRARLTDPRQILRAASATDGDEATPERLRLIIAPEAARP